MLGTQHLLLFITSGNRPIQPIIAIRPGASGDISVSEGQPTNAAVAWSKLRGGPYRGSEPPSGIRMPDVTLQTYRGDTVSLREAEDLLNSPAPEDALASWLRAVVRHSTGFRHGFEFVDVYSQQTEQIRAACALLGEYTGGYGY